MNRDPRIPPPRGARQQQVQAPVSRRGLFIGAGAVAAAILLAICDQVYTPDPQRTQEELSAQLRDAVAHVDRLTKQKEDLMDYRNAIANGWRAGNEPPRRWTGEPYESVPHHVRDVEKRLGNLTDDIAKTAKRAKELGDRLARLDANGGRRVPVLNRLIARIWRKGD